jgi:environmental stress-induced protein Ves
MVEVLGYDGLPSLPWKNGAGQTKEVARSPLESTSENFDWRLSIAVIQQSGPFSAYPGVERTLVNCGEGSVDLDINGSIVQLKKYEQAAFHGTDNVYATLRHGPTHDLNLMTRNSTCTGEIRIHSLNGRVDVWDPGLQALVVLAGRVEVDGVALAQLDSIVRSGADAPIVFDNAVIAVIMVRPLQMPELRGAASALSRASEGSRER